MRSTFIPSVLVVFLGISCLPSWAGAADKTSEGMLRPIQFIDAAGRSVQLDAPPRRIIVIGRGPHLILHLLYMFPEGRERLAGMEKRGKSASDFLDLIDPAFKGKKSLGVSPGPEAIAALQPDLVLIKGSSTERMSDALAKIGIPVAYFSLETPDEFYRDVANAGMILGNSTRAGEITAFFRARIERIQKALAGLAEEKKPRVLLVMATARGGTYAVQLPAAGWMQTFQVRTAGGAPVWLDAVKKTSGWTIVNLEQIARWNPDKIFVVVWYSIDPQKMIDSFKADPQWRALKAIKDGELWAFPSDIFGWDSPDPRWILGLTWLAGRIHPGAFKDTDMSGEIREFYLQLFKLDRNSVDSLILPKVRLDVR